jgi:hypothetical protein
VPSTAASFTSSSSALPKKQQKQLALIASLEARLAKCEKQQRALPQAQIDSEIAAMLELLRQDAPQSQSQAPDQTQAQAPQTPPRLKSSSEDALTSHLLSMSDDELQDEVLRMALDSTNADAEEFERAIEQVINSPRYSPKKKKKPKRLWE